MKTEMQDTSLEAFKDIKNHKKEKRCIQVYNVIKKFGSCPNSVISKELGLFPHEVSGRTWDLRYYFKVVGFSHKDYCPIKFNRDGTKRLVNFWKVVRDFDSWDNVKLNNQRVYKD